MAACKYTSKDIGLYLLNKMSPEEEADFQFHLNDCETCRVKLEEMRRLAEGFREEEGASAGMVSLVPKKNKTVFLLKIVSTIAALVLIGYFITVSTGRIPDAGSVQQGLSPGVYHHGDSIRNERDSIPGDTV